MIDKEFARQANDIMNDNSFFIQSARGSLLSNHEKIESELIEWTEKRISERATRKLNEMIFEKLYCPVPFYFIPRVGKLSLLDSIGKKEDMGRLGTADTLFKL